MKNLKIRNVTMAANWNYFFYKPSYFIYGFKAWNKVFFVVVVVKLI